MLDFSSISALELVAASLGLLAIAFNSVGRIWGWPIGGVAVLIAIYFNFTIGIYGQMLLNGYYFLTIIYGFIAWLKNKGNADVISPKWATKMERLLSLLAVGVCWGFLWLGVNAGLKGLEAGASPLLWFDLLIVALSMVGQVLLARRRIDNWLVWAVVNPLTFVLYLQSGYIFYAFVSVITFFLGIFGLYKWISLYRKTLVITK